MELLIIEIPKFFVEIGAILAGSDVLSYVGGRGIIICSFLGKDNTDITEGVEDIPWVFLEVSP